MLGKILKNPGDRCVSNKKRAGHGVVSLRNVKDIYISRTEIYNELVTCAL